MEPVLKRSHMKQPQRHCTFLHEACCLIDRIQFHTEKRDPLRRGEFALFPVDPKVQLAEVREHQVPVFAQLVLRLWQYEPVVEVVENANALFSQGKRAASTTFVRHGRQKARRVRTLYSYARPATQTAGMACGAEGLDHEVRILQVNAASQSRGRIHPRCTSAVSLLNGSLPSSGRADPRLVSTHRLSWAQ